VLDPLSLLSLLFHILLLPPRWGVTLVLALYPPQHPQTSWILSTYTYLESIPLQLCGGINHSFIYFGFLPLLEAQKESCWDVATPHQILFWSEHDRPGFNISISHMLPSPKYISNFQLQNSSKSTFAYVFLAQWDMSLEESFAEDV
jgi:hypothetical protein